MPKKSWLEQSAIVAKYLEEYRSFHQNKVNILLHLVGIPTIIFGLIMGAWAGLHSVNQFAWFFGLITHLFLLGLMVYHIRFGGWRGWLVALLTIGLYLFSTTGWVAENFGWWLMIEGSLFILILMFGSTYCETASWNKGSLAFAFGLITLLMIALFYLQLRGLAVSPATAALALVVGGLLYQVPGHFLFEGNKPAALTSKKGLTQVFVAAPQEFVELAINMLRLRLKKE